MYPCIVEEAPKPPSRCLFSQDHDGPWIDTGIKAFGVHPYGYIGVRYVERLATDLLDMIPRSQVQTQIEDFERALDLQAERIKELESFVESVTEYQETREGAGIA